MSKMPAKKKSCFQITSVTTAQVATSITEDTESLDDPDESRTEDVSSEIFDVSRTTDYGPEEVCERSSSEETLNNVGEAGTPGTVSPNLLLDGQLAAAAAAPPNGGGAVSARSVGAPGGPSAAGPPPGPGPAAPSQPPATCSSRFRVIKLDHGSGEPYRRGRWTCMEYYERDADSSVLTRSGDCIRHSSTFDQPAERDSGLGATGGSVVVVVAAVQGTHGADSGTDSPLSAVSQLPPAEKASQPAPAPPPSFGVGQPPLLPPVGGALAPSGALPPPFPAGAAPRMATPQPGAAPAAGPSGPALPPANVVLAPPGTSAPQQFAYPQPPMAPAHLLPGQPAGPSDYLQQHVAGLPPPGPAPAGAPAASLPVGASSQAAEAGAPGPQVGGGAAAALVPGGPLAAVPGVPNVPAAAPAPSGPGVPTASVTMPNAPAPLSAGLGPHAGPPSAPPSLPPAEPGPGQFQSPPAAASGQVDDTRRKSEPLPQPPLALLADHKPAVKPPVADALANPLQLTPMNSLATSVFSIAIPVDGDDDSASGGGVVAIDNKIEQAMDLVKSHLMYAVREEVEVLKEQIKELVERNSLLERENALLKSLSNNDQLSQLPAQQANPGSTSQQQAVIAQPPQPTQPPQQPNVSSA
ncbi:TSC22 domain family protein 2 isoform X2 [Tenrec ecaudatus]|uniref:TSC22 domain family protein 2 isoform X2 n=1 Tax=Tenrec ecaudatus TaxID=94439 RepID=UPI003F5909E0